MGIVKMMKKTVGLSDYSDVVSLSNARELVDLGELAPLYLIGLRFGGAEDMSNCVFVPPEAAAEKDQYDDIIADLLEEGRIKSFSCVPQYKGRSAVPCRITITAKRESGSVEFEETINIW